MPQSLAYVRVRVWKAPRQSGSTGARTLRTNLADYLHRTLKTRKPRAYSIGEITMSPVL